MVPHDFKSDLPIALFYSLIAGNRKRNRKRQRMQERINNNNHDLENHMNNAANSQENNNPILDKKHDQEQSRVIEEVNHISFIINESDKHSVNLAISLLNNNFMSSVLQFNSIQCITVWILLMTMLM